MAFEQGMHGPNAYSVDDNIQGGLIECNLISFQEVFNNNQDTRICI